MKLAFTSNNPLNSAVVEASTGNTLFIITTPYRPGKRKTTIRDAQGRTVARYKRRWGRDQVEINGRTRAASSWLSSAGLFTSARKFTAPNGRTYVWKKQWGKSKFKLLDRHTKRVVARSHSSRASLWSSRHMTLEVDGGVVPILDSVLLSFIICEKSRRDSDTAAVTSAAATV